MQDGRTERTKKHWKRNHAASFNISSSFQSLFRIHSPNLKRSKASNTRKTTKKEREMLCYTLIDIFPFNFNGFQVFTMTAFTTFFDMPNIVSAKMCSCVYKYVCFFMYWPIRFFFLCSSTFSRGNIQIESSASFALF